MRKISHQDVSVGLPESFFTFIVLKVDKIKLVLISLFAFGCSLVLDKGSGLTKMGLLKRGNVGSALESQNDLGWKGLLKIWLNPAAMDRDGFH